MFALRAAPARPSTHPKRDRKETEAEQRRQCPIAGASIWWRRSARCRQGEVGIADRIQVDARRFGNERGGNARIAHAEHEAAARRRGLRVQRDLIERELDRRATGRSDLNRTEGR